MPVISVIIPVFGVEKYIGRCARSLFEQTAQDIEFIFVNDCTRDSSMSVLAQVIDSYPNIKDRIRIIEHKDNLGLPQARRTGILAAQGEYIAHCDSDDWLDRCCFERVLEVIRSTRADMVVYDYRICGDGELPKDEYDDFLLADSAKALKSAVALLSSPYVWNKVVHRSCYDGVRYPNAFLAEDWALTVQLVNAAVKIVPVHDVCYNYFFSPDSSRRKDTKELCLARVADETANIRLVKDLFVKSGLLADLREEFVRRESVTKSLLWPVLADRNCRKVWRRTFREANIPILFNSYIEDWYKRRHFRYLNELYWLTKEIRRIIR